MIGTKWFHYQQVTINIVKIVNDSKMGRGALFISCSFPILPSYVKSILQYFPLGLVKAASGVERGLGVGVGVGKGEELSYAHSLATVHCLRTSSQ